MMLVEIRMDRYKVAHQSIYVNSFILNPTIGVQLFSLYILFVEPTMEAYLIVVLANAGIQRQGKKSVVKAKGAMPQSYFAGKS